jgi:hypothetical protein
MPTETTVAHDATDDQRIFHRRSPLGNWEIHSWGDAKFPGMAVVSAITALQVGATLASACEDKVALNNAVAHLMDALAPQLKTFQQALAADRSNRQQISQPYPGLVSRNFSLQQREIPFGKKM